ncbi:MAG: glycoside hydrolase family 43 protein [Muribaculaceae bacterium]|nr:glycoside hydrolase family 43 protein [Muribaculaceae bacterium]
MRNAAIIAALTVFAAACSASQKGTEPVPGVALFDDFVYTGSDSIYAICPLADSASYHNPILPGWYSDPSVCTNGQGDYFLVTSTFCYYPGVPVFHSRDMVNWRQIGHVLNRPEQLKNFPGQHISGGIFAPAISYNPANKTYYMITTNVGAGNFFVKTTDPFSGNWSDPVYLPEVQGIDPAFFFDEDGKAYIVNNDDAPDGKPEYDGHRTVRVVEFDTATDKCVGERKIVVNKGWRPQDKPIWCEGPHIYKINGTYYLMTAEGGTGDWHSEVIYRGPSPFGPFTPYEKNPILTQRNLDRERPNPITCAGHADLIQTTEGDWWAVFLACRPNKAGFENLGRETFMLPVEWTADGWPVINPDMQPVAMTGTRPGAVRDDAHATFGNFTVSDSFDSTALDQRWMTLRAPATDLYSLTERPGMLALKCAPVSATEKATPAFAARRLQHHAFDCSATMTFLPDSASQCAGLLLFKDEKHQYLLGRGIDAEGAQCIFVDKVSPEGIETIASEPVDPAQPTVTLAISSPDGLTFDFGYLVTGESDTLRTVATGVDAGHTSTARAGGFTGTVVGPYATSSRYTFNK